MEINKWNISIAYHMCKNNGELWPSHNTSHLNIRSPTNQSNHHASSLADPTCALLHHGNKTWSYGWLHQPYCHHGIWPTYCTCDSRPNQSMEPLQTDAGGTHVQLDDVWPLYLWGRPGSTNGTSPFPSHLNLPKFCPGPLCVFVCTHNNGWLVGSSIW